MGQGRRVRSRRRATALVCVAVLSSAVTSGVLAGPGAPLASASGDGGASSRVVGRGDIVTTIVGWRLGARVPARRGAAPRCRWVTMQDAQIEWLAAASSRRVLAEGIHPVLDSVRAHLERGDLPDGDLQVRVCRGIAVDLRFVPSSAGPGAEGTVQRLHRRMITRLPVPEPVWSPPPDVAVPLGQPVFLSIPPQRWQPVEASLTVDGVTATVRARPVRVRAMSGDPTGRPVVCDGPGTPFDPGARRSVRSQASAPGACVLRYRTASLPPSAGAPSEPWIGTVTVLWEAEWREDGGEWISLGTIPRTRLFDRRAREVLTTIESRR